MIVGGGVIGVSLAYHLVMLGHPDVTVVERGLLGEGATAKATGGIRTQFSSRVNVELALASAEYYDSFEERVGEQLDFRHHGYLFVIHDEQHLEQFRQNVELQRSLGVRVELLTAQDLEKVVPGIRTDDVVGGVYTPDDGSASPADATRGFAAGARARGASLVQHTPVVGIDRDREGRVAGVRTPAGTMPAEVVVIAAGPWTAQVGALADVDIPVYPHSRQAFGIGPLPGLDPGLPFTIDLATGAYLHPEVYGGVIGGNDRHTPESDEAKVDWSLIDQLVAALVQRIPWLADARVNNGWAGLREMTPDDHGIVGPAPDVPGLWVAAGFSGHGFMQAPAVGDELARALLGLPPVIDMEPLRYTRFAENALVSENALF